MYLEQSKLLERLGLNKPHISKGFKGCCSLTLLELQGG